MNVTALAEVVDIHGYLNKSTDFFKISGAPLIEMGIGQGRILAHEMTVLEALSFDPIAGRIFSNMVLALHAEQRNDQRVFNFR